MNLSKNFTLAELTTTSTGLPNDPTGTAIDCLTALATNILQPLRDHLQRPITVTSGYRSPEVNKAVGGKLDSQHGRGEAADIVVPGMAPEAVAQTIIDLRLPYDQVIIERANGKAWVHVSYSPRNRREVLTYNGKSYDRITT